MNKNIFYDPIEDDENEEWVRKKRRNGQFEM